MKSIVTGATSFIGIALIKKLIQENREIIAIIRPNSKRRSYLPISKHIKVIESDLSNLDKIIIKEGDFDVFYHIGWSSDFINPRYNLMGQLMNVEFGENAVKLAKKCGCHTFLSLGSQAECGRINGCITVKTPPKPETAYAIAKVILHEKISSYCETNGMKFCSPRLLSGYGPYDHVKTLIMTCIKAGMQNRAFETTLAEQIWDYIFVDDIAEALFLIAKNGKHAKRYPIGSGIGRSLKSYIIEISEIMQCSKLLDGIGKKAYASGQIMNLLADISELKHDTGFSPKWSFVDGIKTTITEMKNVFP